MVYRMKNPAFWGDAVVYVPGRPELRWSGADDVGVFRIDGEPRHVWGPHLGRGLSEWARITDSPWEVRYEHGERHNDVLARLVDEPELVPARVERERELVPA